MAQIQILDHVVYSDGSSTPVTATVTHDGCTIVIEEQLVATVSWDTMSDVGYLSELFADITVRKFKVIVDMLGKVYAGRDVYKLLV